MSMRMRSRERMSDKEANRWAWRWSIGLILIIALFPVVAALLGELIAMALGCQVAVPSLSNCTRPNAFLESFALTLMGMIRWAIITVPTAIVALVGLFITYQITKKRAENRQR